MQRGAKNAHHWEQMVKLEFASQSIIANWGNKRTYIVTDIDFGTDPHKQKFDYRGVDTSVADYFKTNYGMVVTDHKQPLFLIRNQDRDFYLPPEFCLLDGVSDEVRKGRGMRDALMQTRITPQTKIKKIQDMCRELFSKKSIKQWGLELEPQPIRMSTSILAAPRIFKQNQVINCDENALRRLPIQKPVALEHERWIFVYENRNENFAN
jgi:hypothetical protein